MANRRRIDPGVLEEVKGYIADVLQDTGELTVAQRETVSDMIDRGERTMRRYVDEVAAELADGRREVPAPETHESGLEALLDRGKFSFAEDELKRLCFAYAGNLKALHRDAVKLAEKLNLAGPVSHVQLTRKFNAELAGNEKALIRRGILGFKDSSMYVRWSAGYRNEVWQIDATKLDFWMMPAGTNTRIRPWSLFIIDDYSRVILSASLLLHEYNAADSAACVHRAMRVREITLPDGRTIDVGGRPEKILCDNAQQFTGQVLSQVAMSLGFTMWAVAAYGGEKKGKVERVIRAANEDYARRLPGYANIDLKTLSMRDALHAVDEQLLNEQQAVDELGKWVEEWNHSPHPDHPGKSRYEVWADDDHAIEAVEDDLLRPATLALPKANYTYSKSGFRTRRAGQNFYHLDVTDTLEVRERYLLRHLPGETAWVDAYDLEGRYLMRCWDSKLLSEEQRQRIEQERRETYRTLASLRSEGVVVRHLAVAEVHDTAERPNPIAAARQQADTSPAPDIVRNSLPNREPAVAALPAAARRADTDVKDPQDDETGDRKDPTSPASYDELVDAALGTPAGHDQGDQR